MKKRLLSLLLILVMLLGLLPTAVFAAEEYVQSINIAAIKEGTCVGQSTANADVMEEGKQYDVYLTHIPSAAETIFVSEENPPWLLQTVIDDYNTLGYAEGHEEYAKANRESAFFREGIHGYTEYGVILNDGVQLSTTADILLVCAYNDQTEEIFYILIEWEKGATVSTADLKKALEAGPSVAQVDGQYTDTTVYHEGDRYNGSTTAKDFAKELGRDFENLNSFWSIYLTARSNAEDMKTSKLQSNINAATEQLEAATKNLVPTTQINPTGLYEKFQTYNNEEVYNDTRYSVASWGEFYSKRTQAQKLLDSLFTKDEKGNVIPTAENSTAKTPQSDVDALVASLVEAAAALDGRVYSRVKFGSENALAGIALYASRYDPNKLNKEDYTRESWDAFVAARGEALNVAKDHGRFTTTMGMNEAQLQVDAFVKLRAACHGLVENKDKIHVTVSLFDDSGARDSKATPIKTQNEINVCTFNLMFLITKIYLKKQNLHFSLHHKFSIRSNCSREE